MIKVLMRHKILLFALVSFSSLVSLCVAPLVGLGGNGLAIAKEGSWPGTATSPEANPRAADVAFYTPYYTRERTSARLRLGDRASDFGELSDPAFLHPEEHLRLAFAPVRMDLTRWDAHTVALGEELGCLARRSEVPWDALAKTNRLLNPTVIAGQTISMPRRSVSNTLAVALAHHTPLVVAMRNNVSLWDVWRLNGEPMYTGEEIVLPGEGAASCLPYPVRDLMLSPQPVVRGQTAILGMETAVPVTCQVTYLGQSESCYREGSRVYAFVGLSPLIDAGGYDLHVRIRYVGGETAFTLPLEIDAGHYGRQWINPPAALHDLLDPDVYFGESKSLDPLRAWRSSKRYWDLPLRSPLDRISISAGFGDWRSYGGVFESYHSGVDVRGWWGMPVYAPAAGRVVMTGTLRVRGNAVLIDHGWGLITGYWHLSEILVQEGQLVEKGQVIAKVGNTGLSTGSHLHWEMWVNGVSVNGLQWVEPKIFAEVPFGPAVNVSLEMLSESVTASLQ
jgi:murein DD-endopeptidase MepM/ murein hydrolase activator NlpD